MENGTGYFWQRVKKTRGCWLWTGNRTDRGYGIYQHAGVRMLAHRYAWEQEHGPIPRGHIVIRKCDTAACVKVGHMRLGTQSEIALAAVAERGAGCGEANATAKLRERDVLIIRESLKKRSRGDVAGLMREFSVTAATIYSILYRRSWKHV